MKVVNGVDVDDPVALYRAIYDLQCILRETGLSVGEKMEECNEYARGGLFSYCKYLESHYVIPFDDE